MNLKNNKAAQLVKKHWKLVAYTSAVVVVTVAVTKTKARYYGPLLVGPKTDPVFFGVPLDAINGLKDGVGGVLTYNGNLGKFDIVMTPPAR